MPPQTITGLELERVAGDFAVCRMAPGHDIPDWARGGVFVSVTRTPDELSVVCESHRVPADIRAERDWACLRVRGVLDFNMIGILAELTSTLARARISLFAVSTFDTDYVLVRALELPVAVDALRAAGHEV
jgi:hypothetical protein